MQSAGLCIRCPLAISRGGSRFLMDYFKLSKTGPGGKQIQLEDPDGNPVELFEPAS